MKKFSILLFSALALICSSCDEELIPAEPQANAQESLVEFDGLTVAAGTDISAALDLSSASDSITVVNTVASPVLGDGQVIEYVTYVASQSDYSDAVYMETANGDISVADLNTQFRTFFGNAPDAKDMYFQFAAYVAEGDNKVRFGGSDIYFAQTTVSVTPISIGYTIEDAYYLVGEFCNWTVADAVIFTHSDASVYDDTTFGITIEIADNANGYDWEIIPQSSYLAGTRDNVVASGSFGAFGTMSISIDVLTGEYTCGNVSPYIYLIGTPGGWNISDETYVLTSANLDNIYTANFVFASGEDNYFRFYTAVGDWDTGSIGSAVDDGTNYDATMVDDIFTGSLVSGKGCYVIADGVYKFTVNLNTMTLTIEPGTEGDYAAIYTVGNINGWSMDAEATEGALYSVSDNGIYTGTLTLPDSGDGYSYFRFYSDLDGDWGTGTIGTESAGDEEVVIGDDGIGITLVIEGNEGSFKVPVGTYDFTVDLFESILLLEFVE